MENAYNRRADTNVFEWYKRLYLLVMVIYTLR